MRRVRSTKQQERRQRPCPRSLSVSVESLTSTSITVDHPAAARIDHHHVVVLPVVAIGPHRTAPHAPRSRNGNLSSTTVDGTSSSTTIRLDEPRTRGRRARRRRVLPDGLALLLRELRLALGARRRRSGPATALVRPLPSTMRCDRRLDDHDLLVGHEVAVTAVLRHDRRRWCPAAPIAARSTAR